MIISLRALRRGMALQRTGGLLSAAAVAYSAGACTRLPHKDLPHEGTEENVVRQQNISLRLTEIKGSSEGVKSEEPIIRSSAVAAQIAEVAESIKLMQGKIFDVGAKIEATEVALDQANLAPEKKEILLMQLKSLMDEKKCLMDKEAKLMDKEAKLMDEKKSLMDKEAILMGSQPPQPSSASQSWLDWFTKWWKVLLAGGTSLGLITTVFAAMAAFNRDTNRSIEALQKRLSNSLADVKPMFLSVPVSSIDYVPRPTLEAEILAVYNNKSLQDGSYYIVYGVKGAGKTSAVTRVLGDKTGVVAVRVSQTDKVETIFAKFFQACGEVLTPASKVDKITTAMQAATEKRDGRPVTVVIEIERGSSSPDVLSLVKHVAKDFALAANVLIVLSEANAVLGFGDDSRQKYILVEEMKLDEAVQYVKKRAPSISPEDFNKFAVNCGTLPLSLGNFCDDVLKGETVDGCIAKEVAMARRGLEAFILKPILAALKTSPDGVQSGSFDGVKHEGVLLSSPTLVAPAMKITNAIMYDFGTGQYKLFSKAHQTALKTYDPPQEGKWLKWWT